ncbi:hypothetical protein BH24ACT26_BH24ACT26_06930 [soil metagenome]
MWSKLRPMLKARTRLIAASAAVLFAGFLVVTTTVGSVSSSSGPKPSRGTATAERAKVQAPPDPEASAAAQGDGDLRSYALSLGELQGLSGNAPPGTRLELWVTWEPPVTRRPRIDLLIEDAVLEKIVPALSPQQPGTALVLVRSSQISDLLWADRYGSLSATVQP